jgi:hypothetical protein
LGWVLRLAKEPPLRIVARALLKLLPVSVETRALWELSARPAYLVGVLEAARQAQREGVGEIAAIEFGVAGGEGLLALEAEAAAVEAATGVRIRVFGFDRGRHGLPEFIGDYRDHPDVWRPGDYPMDEEALRRRLSPRTELVLGNVRDTVPAFVERADVPPVGFVSVDVDLYSSSRDALRVLSHPAARTLAHVPLYFDDVDFFFNHRFAGELLAIEEFNREHEGVKIDRWRGVRVDRPFPERPFLDKLYVAHRLEAISRMRLGRAQASLPLSR